MTFSLDGQDFIPLNALLKALHLVGTGGEANARISAGEARINGETDTRKRRKVRAGDVVEFDGTTIAVEA